ncbi:aromatic ring-opening dioxygenase, LigB subunit, putative [Bodo saltans]|uniref:Aromatic ring-opening dioxygenase, LigB subunit, putative n=1 Tax=Bodo saltans TaxID=75058 RepID=A0A0S4JK40_BODSA|nr:aromatic ring-opening dioxygenase, LigB subunit, putative [Bodo saltans]|eukprot:CUG88857.1 aromatic ring-opening dioxygenase, LigB subunit, putative [Bodo saltans]
MTQQVASAKFPVLFVNHGGGPLPLLGDPKHKELVAAWTATAASLLKKYGKPKVIGLISAHYETHQPSIGGAAEPKMLYDYGGFPSEAYKLQYPARGVPDLAKRMVERLVDSGIGAALDKTRPFDHGVFVPLMKMFPDADIPVIPISVLRSQNAAEHIAMGRVLSEFRKEGVLFIGSGMTMHNFKYFGKSGEYGTTFNNSLTKVLADPDLSSDAQIERMKDVRAFPGIAESQPDGGMEHLMPLLTCVGISQGGLARETASVSLMSANVREYIFE